MMEPMLEDHGPLEAILTEIRAVREVQSAKFDSIEREQADMKTWLGRLSDALERQVAATTKLFTLEAHVGNISGELSDIKLDQASMKDDIVVLQKDNARRSMIDKILAAVAGAGITAIAAEIAAKFFHPS